MELQKHIKLLLNKVFKHYLVWLCILQSQTILFSQNLVVNGNCELYSNCPDNYSQIDSLNDFSNFAYWSTSDYLNICSSNEFSGIPSIIGNQFPHSGNGYIHSIMIQVYNYPRSYLFFTGFDSIQSRENILGEFSSSLIPGKQYKFEVYTSFANIGDSINCDDRRIATNAFDVMFFDTLSQPYVGCEPYIDLTTVIDLNSSGKIIDDTLNWVKLSVCYTAKGGEKHFALGSFRDTSDMDLKYTDCFFPNGVWSSFYFFDDFSMVQCDTCCGNIPPVEPFSESLDVANSASTNSKPIVFTANLFDNSYAKMEIYDSRGRIVERHTFTTDDNLYTPSISLQKALYHYRFETENGFYQSGKFVVVE